MQTVYAEDAAWCGTVFRKSQGEYSVHLDNRIVSCALSNRLRKELVYPVAREAKIRSGLRGGVVAVDDIPVVDPVAIGDRVRIIPAEEGRGMIVEVLPRRNELVRRAAGARKLKQVIVANADQILPVIAAAQPRLSWELLDRYLAAAEDAGLNACIVITKLDLVDDRDIVEEIETYRRIGYPAILTSTRTGRGIEELKGVLKNCISVTAGKSGVGKTSLLNSVQPGLGLRVSGVSAATGKGKHTTTYLEMFRLEMGGAVVDTPGMREFGIWNDSTARQRHEHETVDVAHLFREMRPYLGGCRFGLDCSHRREPGCAIRKAVDAGDVSERRYRSYLRIAGDTDA